MDVQKSAVLSDCGRYRYRLDRWWGKGRRLSWVMLNPSKADAEVDDHTIRRCMFYSRREGFAGISVVNLFAYRATDPKELLAVEDPLGPDNLHWLWHALRPGHLVVAAFGGGWRTVGDTTSYDLVLSRAGVLCLGTTQAGDPRHPSRLSNDVPMTNWNRPNN